MKTKRLVFGLLILTLLLFIEVGGQITPLLPGFSFKPVFPCVGDAIQFMDLSRGGPETWHWDFGDGSESNERNPSHVYQAEGEYLISFTITRGNESVTMDSTALMK